MEPEHSLLSPSQIEAYRTLSIQKIGVVHVPQDCLEAATNLGAAIEKQFNSGASNISESARLSKLLDRKIQMRLRKQKEIHKIDKELGDIMRLFRSNAGITLSAMAYKTNMPFVRLHEIEQGTRSATLLDLVTIFRQYNVQITEAVVRLKKLHGL